MIADLACPHCGRVNEAHDGVTTSRNPSPGDVMICWKCADVGIFTPVGIRLPTAEELERITADPRVAEARAAITRSHTPSDALTLLQRRTGRREARLPRQAAEVVVMAQTGSAALLQRRLGIGQALALELLEVLAERGVVGPAKGPGRVRDVLVTPDQLVALLRDHFPLGPP